MRLEFGFADIDSLGRVYNQPPFPHVRPAVEPSRLYLGRELQELVAKMAA